MADVFIHQTTFASSAPFRLRRFAALLGRSLDRAMIAHSARRALDELPDNLLRDMGIARGEIPFVAGALASGNQGLTRDAARRMPQVALTSRLWRW